MMKYLKEYVIYGGLENNAIINQLEHISKAVGILYSLRHYNIYDVIKYIHQCIFEIQKQKEKRKEVKILWKQPKLSKQH